MTPTKLELKVPPPIVALLAAGLMWGISRNTPSWEITGTARVALASLAAAAGIAIGVAGAGAFRRAQTTINPTTPEAASSLVSSGVYRMTRNPMYLGLLMVLIGWAVFLSSAWALVGAAAFAFYIRRFQIVPEERALAARFGAQYTAYRERVRRWV